MVKRGEIYYADLSPVVGSEQGGLRPVLIIQNDIGTNDVHVLVIQVEGFSITLTYSDLHERRFAFFQGLLSEIGAQWSDVGARRSTLAITQCAIDTSSWAMPCGATSKTTRSAAPR